VAGSPSDGFSVATGSARTIRRASSLRTLLTRRDTGHAVVFSQADKVILDKNTGGVIPYLPLNELRRGAGETSEQ